jgi:hypothetical protein
MLITIGFFPWERINHFPFISYGKKLFGIRPVWYKSKDLERIKDEYRGTTVYCVHVSGFNGASAATTVCTLLRILMHVSFFVSAGKATLGEYLDHR